MLMKLLVMSLSLRLSEVSASTYTTEKGDTVTIVTTSAADKTPKPDARGMEYVFATKGYNVAEFYEEFKDNLPQLVKVVQGYCGDIAEDVYDRDQVICLQAVSRQHRAISKFKVANHAERLFSIPLNYFEKFCIVEHGRAGKEQFLFEILRGSHLPLTVRLAKDRIITVGKTNVSTNRISNIELLQVFEEVYLLGNFIYDGKLCTDVVHVPLYLSELRISNIIGIKGHSASQWKTFQVELKSSSSGVEYDEGFGNQKIAEYDPNAIHSGATCSYVEPHVYSNIVSGMQRPVVLGTADPEDEINQSQSKRGGQQKYSAQAVNQENCDEYKAIANTSRPNEAAPNFNSLKKELESKFKAGLHMVTPPKGKTLKTNLTACKAQYTHGGQGNHSSKAVDQEYGDEYEEIQYTAQQNKAVPTVISFNKKLKSKVSAVSHKLFPQTGQKRKEYSTTPPVVPHKPSHTSISFNQNKPPALPQRTSKVPESKTQTSESHTYANDVPRTQISPTVHDKPTTIHNPSPHGDTVKPSNSQDFGSENVPIVSNRDDVSKLTIDQVAAYLKKLGLGQYENTFKEQMIDGTLLVELDKDLLKDDFGMKPIEALKLAQFAKDGHVPV